MDERVAERSRRAVVMMTWRRVNLFIRKRGSLLLLLPRIPIPIRF